MIRDARPNVYQASKEIAAMSIGNKSNMTSLPIEPHHRLRKPSRVRLGLLALLVLAAGIGLLFASACRNNTSQQASKEAAIQQPAPAPAAPEIAQKSPAEKPAAAAPVKPERKATSPRPAAPRSVAEIRAHAKMVGARAGLP